MEGRRCIQLFRFVTPMSRSRVIAPICAVCAAGSAQLVFVAETPCQG